MVKTEAPAYAKAAGNSYSLHLPLARLSSTLRVLKPSFSIFQRARAARTSCTMLALVGTRSVTQALR